MIAPMYVFAVGLGLTLPNGMAGAVGPFPRMAGLAAAVAGFLQLTGSALYSVAVGHFFDGTARPMTTAIALAGVAALACFWRLRWRRRRRRASMSAMAARRAKIIRFPTASAPEAAAPASRLPRSWWRRAAAAIRRRPWWSAGCSRARASTVVLQSRLAPSVYPFSVGHQAEVLLLVAAADLPRALAVLARRA